MKIAFFCKHINTLTDSKSGVWGEEIYCNALVKGLNKIEGVTAKVYGENTGFVPQDYDWVIYTYNPKDDRVMYAGKKNALFLLNGIYDNAPLPMFYDLMKISAKYNLYISHARKFAQDKAIPFVGPCVDMDIFKPQETDDSKFCPDVSFVGNPIKSAQVVGRYAAPFGSRLAWFGMNAPLGKIGHEDSLKLFTNSLINISFGHAENIGYDLAIARPVQVAACKGFILSDKLPFYVEHFKDAFAFTDGASDSLVVANRFLTDDMLRNEYRERAYSIVKEKFTCEVVAGQLKDVLCQAN